MKFKVIVRVLSSLNSRNFSLFKSKLSRRVWAPTKAIIFKLFRSKTQFNTKDAIVVFSEARGGSTWVMEQLQLATEGVSVFEPLWGRHGAFKRIAHQFSSPFYMGKDSTESLLFEFLKKTMEGKETSWRTLQFNDLKTLMKSNQLVVKLVNTNLIAPWFVSKFDLKHKPIYVIRHPLAIVYSRDTYGSKSSTITNAVEGPFDWNRIKSDKHPYLEYKELINQYDTKFERYLIEWCIRNASFLNGQHDDRFAVLYYEEILIRPEVVWKEVLENMNLTYKSGTTEKASGTTSLTNKKLKGAAQTEKWMVNFDKATLDNFQRIFDLFEIKTYSVYSSLPIHLTEKINS